MKHILAYIALFFFVSLMSCGHSSGDYDIERSFWPPIEAEADSLVAFLNEKAVHTVYDAADTVIADRIDSIGRAKNNNQLRARALFWRVQAQSRSGIGTELAKLIDSAVTYCDSLNYPYDYHRIQTSRPLKGQSYKDLIRYNVYGAEFFKIFGDSLSYACSLSRLSYLLERFNDVKSYIKYSQRALEVLRNIGAHEVATIQEFNLAYDLLKMGEDSVKAFGILERLLADTLFTKHNYLTERAYILLYKDKRDKKKLLYALDRCYNPGVTPGLRCLLFARLADCYLHEDNVDSMMYYKNKLYENWDYVSPYAPAIYGIMVNIMNKEGKIDSAQIFEKELQSWNLVCEARKEGAELEAANMRHYVESIENELKAKHNEGENRLWIIIGISFGAVILVAITLFFLRRQHRKTRREQQKVSLSKIQVAEKDRAMAELVDNIGSGDVNASVIARIRAQLTPDSDWERVELMIEKDNPEFAEKLMRKFPHLTQAERRLACLIYLGLDNKHIARLLSIAPESVKKTRHRLRAKLPLGPRDDIHHFLTEL